jgi:DNA-binding transcriptional MerR regulator
MDKPITLRQLAKLLEVKYTTLKHRCDLCAEFIPVVRDGKYKAYNNEAVDIIKQINNMYQSGKDINDILPFLAENYDRQIEVQPEQAMQTMSEQSEMTDAEKNRILLEQIVSKFVHKQDEMQYEIDILKKDFSEFKQSVEQSQQRANKPWYKRLFGG